MCVDWCRRGVIIGQLGKVLGIYFSGGEKEVRFEAEEKFEFCWNEVSFSDIKG